MIARTWRGWTSAADADRAEFLLDRERHANDFQVMAAPGTSGPT